MPASDLATSRSTALPWRSVRAPNHLVASADHLATSAGVATFHDGGNAVDAAIATNAVLAVTAPHLCGMGGDLFAIVHREDSSGASEVVALNASGRAGSGADPEAMRAEGLSTMPFKLDVRSVTVPGCVDGWMALHARFGSIPIERLLAPARALAADGFPASPLLVASLGRLDQPSRAQLGELAEQATRPGARVRRPGVALALAALARGGRDSFYRGAFGDGLIELGEGLFVADDFATSQATWEPPLSASAFGVDLHTIAPNSQGYLTLGGCRIAERLDLPDDPDDARWAHLLIEAATAAGFDRPDTLHDRADGRALLAAIDARLDLVDPQRASTRPLATNDGDTTYLCAAGVDRAGVRMGVSLIQSNASGFGSHLVEPTTGINVHNRGIGFHLAAGHPAELAPGRRPPHTLSPALASRQGALAAVFGTMGGDAQPQILLQVATRLFHHRQSPATAINAGRWALHGQATGFDTWTAPDRIGVSVEGHAPESWSRDLADLGHHTSVAPAWDSGFGHAHAIVVEPDGMFAGAADPRTLIGSAAGG
ncbi:MAG: gamma-glutamyltransferase [Ilumatobacteraceae bacterium]